MGVSEIKQAFLASKIQVLQIDTDGTILNSENTIFSFKEGINLTTIHPFFEGIIPLFSEVEDNLHFPCVNLYIQDQELIMDVKVISNNDSLFLILADFTEHYRDSHPLIQEKNEVSIAKHKLAYEKELLIAKEEIKNKFLAHLNHEVRNPLNSMLGFMDLFKNTKLDYEQKEMLSVMKKTGTHLKVLMDDLLDISKIEKGEIEIKSVPFSLNVLVGNLLKHFQLKYANDAIETELIIEDNVPSKIISDPTRINQIFYNLLENSFLNTTQGHITVTLALKNKTTLFATVRDTGKGIPEENLPKIYDSYYQLEYDETLPMGEGLGLRIVKELTQLLKGTITVTSEVNVGTTHYLTLPFTAHNKTERKKKSVPKGTGIILSKRILFAEDDSDHQMLVMKNFLDNDDKGYQLDIANNGKDVVKNIVKKKYDLLILKMKLPDLDGFKILNFIRNHENENIQKLPILVVTGSTMKFEKEAILSAGASSFLPKPYTSNDLFKEIDSLIR
ncbi:ATP-binding response regulator [Cochleicola gelatinilyticus]|uniref:histidine kinase n=1 Tax=Cochleicola gelatinilyticus TaxID=1763537 RepID=A0A167J807_9FLAO|nr:hybrid sensor histidine kinase/response regulator [Cochleicola gelatinilyticus]OAB80411.1 hypothetical protein ULVI_06660 [Cochleicola gelatinilyticus]